MATITGMAHGDSVVGGVFSPFGWGEGIFNKASALQTDFMVGSHGIQGHGNSSERGNLEANIAQLSLVCEAVGFQALSSNDDLFYLDPNSVRNNILAMRTLVESYGLVFFTYLLCPEGIRDSAPYNAGYDALRAWGPATLGPAWIDVSDSVRDPGNPRHWKAEYSTDDVHYTTAGRDAMAAAFVPKFQSCLSAAGFSLPINP